jgi:uncharacterized repeat protein (TIGR03803 family)
LPLGDFPDRLAQIDLCSLLRRGVQPEIAMTKQLYTVSFLILRASVFILLATVIFVLAISASAQTLTPLHTFGAATGGENPGGRLVADSVGNLYGETVNGGAFGRGTIFELSPSSSGRWTETVLYSFTADADDNGAGGSLISDAVGNLYGTTSYGGNGSGTVFQLARPSTPGAAWTRNVLYRFTGMPDGGLPSGVLSMDAAGNIYGETWWGGECSASLAEPGDGTVFKLSQPTTSNGPWTEEILYRFQHDCGKRGEGSHPTGGLAIGKGGLLFGVTADGGAFNGSVPPGGTVFRLAPPSASKPDWTERVLHSFHPTTTDGYYPLGGVIVDNKGNVYGTTVGGGGTNSTCGSQGYDGCGVVFEMSPVAGGAWTESVLYAFTGGDDGSSPQDELLLDASGNLFGVTRTGGTSAACGGPYGPCGAAFELKAPSSSGGAWSEVTLYSFTPGPNGVEPWGGLIFGQFHRLYGVTPVNGATMPHAQGTVFRLIP